MRFFDAHTHVQFAAFADDYKNVIRRALDGDIGLINVGTQKDTSRRAVEIAHEYENEPVFASVGLHPIHTSRSYHDEQELGAPENISINQPNQHKSALRGFVSRAEEFDYEYYKKLAQDPKVVAIGECGLDYYRLRPQTYADGTQIDADKIKERQREAFLAQIELAYEVKKPLMIHCREAFLDLIDILVKCQMSEVRCPGVVHFFSGSTEDARQLLDMGFAFTFGGVITFTRDYDAVIKMIPLDRILSETDAPYVAPIPYRGKRNEPAYVVEVVKKLAEIKQISIEEIASHISKNVKRIFEAV